MDIFLNEEDKKIVGEDIRQHNREKKLQRESAGQDSSSDTAYVSGTVNNIEKTDVPKITNCSSSELSHETGVIKDIANSTMDSKTINDRSALENSEGIGDSINIVNDQSVLEKSEEFGKTVNQENDQDKTAVEPNIVTEFVQGLLEELLSDNDQLHTIKFYSPRTLVPRSISIKKLANSFCQANVAKNKMIVAKRSEITLWCLFSEKFEDKVVELKDGYLRTMTCKARKINKLFGYEYDPVSLKKIDGISGTGKSKTITSHVAKNSETIEKSLPIPEENSLTSSISADEEDYLKMLTGSIDDETAYWGTPYEARIEEGEPNESDNDPDANESDSDVNKSDSDVYFKSDDSDSDDEYDHELHERRLLKQTEMARKAKLEEKTPTKPADDDDIYFDDDGDPVPQLVMMSPIISPVTA
ncbi:hypothetical protein RclHR1_02640015 [Rhizophagus clarus]|uniref:Uncharacterized protein n=1 Tax=Rhizophagus clarus TaxID=94130 RepID=A0A2Z6RG53_9GLOM|nr:hypothetical protein RclHR1_02640015 [Rhizophagus clarus]